MTKLKLTNHDMSYCTSSNCLHRRGCRRNTWNYEDNYEVLNMINGVNCQKSRPYPYDMLIRFRNSDGRYFDEKPKTEL